MLRLPIGWIPYGFVSLRHIFIKQPETGTDIQTHLESEPEPTIFKAN